MAGSLNKVSLIGNVGKDPEVKSFQNGNSIATFSLAMSESRKGKDGERSTHTEWANISVNNPNLIKIVESYVKKGSKLYIEGQLRTRKYESGGVDKYATEVVIGYNGVLTMLDSPSGGSGESRTNTTRGSSTAKPQTDKGFDLDGDDIPF